MSQENIIKKGFCECGCGGLIQIAKRTVKSKGHKRVEPRGFVVGEKIKDYIIII